MRGRRTNTQAMVMLAIRSGYDTAPLAAGVLGLHAHLVSSILSRMRSRLLVKISRLDRRAGAGSAILTHYALTRRGEDGLESALESAVGLTTLWKTLTRRRAA